MSKLKKVIVAHPGKQHVFHLLKALNQEVELHFFTTVYDKKDSLTNRLKRILKGKSLKKASSRRCNDISDNQVTLYCEVGGLLLIFLAKIGFNKLIMDFFYRTVHRNFAAKVASYSIKNKVDAVILFDSNVYDCFNIIKAKSSSIKCILDVTIANRLYMKEIYKNDMENTKDRQLYDEQKHLWNETNLKRYKNEFLISDYLLVGSTFVKKSILSTMDIAHKIHQIPYGVDISQFKIEKKDYTEGSLRLFFVGGINRRKGIHHLLKVISQYKDKEVILTLAGGYNLTSDLYSNYKACPNINFEGFVTRDVVANYYSQSHVFVLPSLSEGLALVGLEALASGLPVLCTENTGVNDLIIDYNNGFVIPASDESALKDKIDWFINNRDKIEIMGKNARKSVLDYSWDSYYKNIQIFFKNLND